MDDLNQGGSIFESINLGRLLPILFIVMVIAGDGMIGVQLLLPAYQENTTLSAEVEDLRRTVTSATQDMTEANRLTLERQIEGANTTLDGLAPSFVTHDEAGMILDRLYTYAEESNVDITTMQVYAPSIIPEGEAIVLNSFRLQVDGDGSDLFAFIARIRELSLPAITISNLTINAGPEYSILVFELLLYTTELAPGEAFADLPELLLPEPILLDTSEAEAPDDTVTTAGIPDVDVDTGEPKQPIEVEAVCNDAPPPMFTPGDAAVVDFNADGALRLLSRLDGGAVYTLTQVYDNDVLMILDGPICGTWQGTSIWYWQVAFEDVVGWAAEATATDRWLCPMNNPECS